MKLDDYNREKMKEKYPFLTEDSWANVECNECGAEMYYPEPHTILPSLPLQKRVKCPKCGEMGYKVV